MNLSGTAKLANVKFAVNYGESLKTYYSRYCASVSTDKANVTDTLGFTGNETRAGFIPAGTLTLKLFAAEANAKMKYFHTEILAEPNDFITVNLDTKPFIGKISVNIIIDKSTEVIEKNIDMDPTDFATEAPVIKLGRQGWKRDR